MSECINPRIVCIYKGKNSDNVDPDMLNTENLNSSDYTINFSDPAKVPGVKI